jgi:hypothetical protein
MKQVTAEKWNAAVNFLMSQEPDQKLTRREQKRLAENFRGPFYDGMCKADAERLLAAMRWKISIEETPR